MFKKTYALKPKGKNLKKNNNKVLATCKNVISAIFTIIMPIGKVIYSISGYVDLLF